MVFVDFQDIYHKIYESLKFLQFLQIRLAEYESKEMILYNKTFF